MELFSTETVKQAMTDAVNVLRAMPERPQKAKLLADVMAIVKSDAATIDQSTQVNAAWVGQSVINLLDKLGRDPPSNSPAIDELYGFFYRFIVELELATPGELNLELRQFVNHARDSREGFSVGAQQQMNFADKWMPLAILKELLGSDVIRNVRSTAAYASSINDKFTEWEKALEVRETHASRLKDALSKYQTAFNFVGLYEGFDLLSSHKTSELRKLRRIVVVMGILAVVPVLAEMVALYLNRANFAAVQWAFAASSLPALSLTVLLVYFFRLAVRNAESVKSQLLQIELRKTLCRFIQSYADYAKSMQDGNKESLTRFEQIIFSAIVGNDDKIPATFDGVDQLANLVKAVRSKG